MNNNTEALIARIDERTKNIQGDVVEIKEKCHNLSVVQNENRERIISLETRIKNGGTNGGFSKRQLVAGFGFIAAFLAALVTAVKELLAS